MEADEKEKNQRKVLNLGHTFAHAYESSLNFSKKLNHGEAVLLGMFIASELSFNKKILNSKELFFIKKHYSTLGLLTNIKKFFKKKEINKIVHFMQKDKKNYNEKINLILLKKIGITTKPKKISLKVKDMMIFLRSYYR